VLYWKPQLSQKTSAEAGCVPYVCGVRNDDERDTLHIFTVE